MEPPAADSERSHLWMQGTNATSNPLSTGIFQSHGWGNFDCNSNSECSKISSGPFFMHQRHTPWQISIEINFHLQSWESCCNSENRMNSSQGQRYQKASLSKKKWSPCRRQTSCLHYFTELHIPYHWPHAFMNETQSWDSHCVVIYPMNEPTSCFGTESQYCAVFIAYLWSLRSTHQQYHT